MKPPPGPHYRHRSPAEIRSSAKPSGCIMCSASAYGMSSCCRGVVASMRRSGAGARSPARPVPAVCAAAGPSLETNGTSTKCSYGSREFSINFDTPWIRRALCSTFSFGHAGMPKQQSVSQAFAERPSICASRDRDRSAAKLLRGSALAASKSRTSTKQISEQSRRNLESSDTPPRAPDATIQFA
jgi:hypothetical protein